MGLSPDRIQAISREVFRKFPEVRQASPAVQAEPGAKSPTGGSGRYLLTYRGSGLGPGGQIIQRIVRVVADDRGKVLKMSTSR